MLPASGSRGTPARGPSATAATRRRAPTAPPGSSRTSPPTRRRTGGRRVQARRPPSELLPPDEVPDDQHDRPAGEQDREQDEETRHGAGELGRVAAEGVGLVDPLAGRPVLSDPEQNRQRERDQEAPEPGEVEPVNMPGRSALHRLLVPLKVVVVALRLVRRVAARHSHRPTPPRRAPTRACSSPPRPQAEASRRPGRARENARPSTPR